MDTENDLLKNFTENGFVIKNVTTFTKEADGIDLNDLIRNLVELKEKMNKGTDVNSFYSEISEKVRGLNSAMTVYGISNNQSLKASLDLINEKTKVASNYASAEKTMNFQKQNMYAEMRAIYELGKRTDLDDNTRTVETLRLYDRKKKCEEAYKKSLSVYTEQKKKYEESLKNFDLAAFKNNFLELINTLDNEIQKIAMTEDVRNSLNKYVSEIRTMVAMFGLESIQSKSEFDKLCKKYGLESTDKKVLNISSQPTQYKEPEIKNASNFNQARENNQPAVDEIIELGGTIENKPKIKTKIELINALTALNPDVNINLVNDGLVIDGSLEAVKLPDGFMINNGIISNALSVGNSNEVVSISVAKKKVQTITSKEELIAILMSINSEVSMYRDNDGSLVVEGEITDIKNLPEGFELIDGVITNRNSITDTSELVEVSVSKKKEEQKIKNANELIYEVIISNPDADISRDSDGNLIVNGELTDIKKLPEGFELIDGIITNRNSITDTSELVEVKVNKKKEEKIGSVIDLVTKLREMNDGIEINYSVVTDLVTVNSKLDTLKLPEGFKIENGKITNRTNNITDINDIVETNIVEDKRVRQSELAHEPRRWSVKSDRKAIIEAYAKSILLGSCGGAVLAGLGQYLMTGGLVGLASVPVGLAAGAVLGTAMYKIYKKACLEGRVDIPRVLERYPVHTEDDVFQLSVVGSEIKKGFSQLMTGFKAKLSDRRKKFQEPVREAVPEPTPAPTPAPELTSTPEPTIVPKGLNAPDMNMYQPGLEPEGYQDPFAPFNLGDSLEEGMGGR